MTHQDEETKLVRDISLPEPPLASMFDQPLVPSPPLKPRDNIFVITKKKSIKEI